MAERAAPPAAVLALVLNAFWWGVSWWPFRALQERGAHPLWSTALIYAVAFAAFALVRPRAVGQLLRQPALWLLAAASGITNVGFNWAVTIGDVVRVVLLFYLMPAWSVLLAWVVLGERPSLAAIGQQTGATLLKGARVVDTRGSHVLGKIRIRTEQGEMIEVASDLLAVAGGWNPNLSLSTHLGGRPRWSADGRPTRRAFCSSG